MSATTTAPAHDLVTGRSGTQIHLEGVTKDFGLPEPAVDQVSLTIEPGEFMTFLGPSGSGKTTTLNLIAGFETLTSGSVLFDGGDVSALPPHKRNLGMLFQNYALFPHLTVAQNVAYPLRERKLPRTEIADRVSTVLELVQLTGRDEHYPAQLSGGQQQRVALARAIVFDPTALLLDEPLGALDRNLRSTLQREIQRIHRELGATFVFVTHDQEEAMNLSDRIALFNRGHLEQVGTPVGLYQSPETLFAARFLGDSTTFDLRYEPGDGVVGWEDLTWTVDPSAVSPRVAADVPIAMVVRPEDMHLVTDLSQVPPGANHVGGTVRHVEYMGSYRTAIVSLGRGATEGRARLDGVETPVDVGQSVLAWWNPARQHVVTAA